MMPSPAPSGKSSPWPGILLFLAVGLASAWCIRQQWAANAAHRLQWAQDTAFFHQIVFAASEGRPWTSSLLLEPTGFFQMVHFYPIFALILPVCLLWPGVDTLLALNVLAVTLSALPLYRLSRHASGSAWFGLAAALAWLSWLPVTTAALVDFVPFVFFVPGFLLLLSGVVRRSWLEMAFGVLLCFATREESAYMVAAMGGVLLLLPLGGWRRRQGLVLLLAGVAWFVVLASIQSSFFYHFDPRTFLGAVEGRGLDPEVTVQRLRHLGWLGLGGFSPFILSPAALGMCIGPLGYLMATAVKEWDAFMGPYAFYRDAILPFLAVGGVLGWVWLVGRLPEHWRRRGLAAAACLMILGNSLSFAKARLRLSRSVWRPQREEAMSIRVAELDRLLALVSPDARVATDYRLIADLSGRRVLWNVAHLYMDDGRPPWWQAEWPLTLDRVDTVLVPLDDPIVDRLDPSAWRRVDRGAGYGLWERVGTAAEWEPLP